MAGNYLRRLGAFVGLVGLLGLAAPPLWAQDEGAFAPPSATLDTVVVTASKTEESKREVTTNITVITQEDIRKSTAKDLSDLMAQNGFQVYDTGGGAKTVYIRGMGGSSMSQLNEMSSRVLILLNGHRTGTNDISLTGLENVERVEIIRGPAAVQYGSSALGGVVNVITKRGTKDFAASLELGGGSYHRFDQKASFSGAGDVVDFSVGVSNTRRSDYETGQGQTWQHTSLDSDFNLDADLGFNFLEKHRLGAHFNYAKINGNELPGSGWPDTSHYPLNFSDNDSFAYNGTLSYTGATEDDLFSWMGAYTFGRNKNEAIGYADPNDPPGPWGGPWPPFYPDPNWLNGTSTDLQQLQLQGTFDNGTFMLTAGFDSINYDYSTSADLEDYVNAGTSTDYAGYALAKLRLFDERFIVSAGGRYDAYKVKNGDFNTDDTNFAPSVGVAFSPVEILKFRANYSEGFVTPTITQYQGNESWRTAASPDLKPEKSKTFEFGADLAWEQLDAGVTYFHTEWKDKIVGSVPVPGRPGWSRSGNLDGATIAGLEMAAGYDLGPALGQNFELKPYISLTWLTDRKNKDPRPANRVPQDPDILPDTPEFMAAYGLTFNHPELGLASTINASYFGKRYSMDFNSRGVSPTEGQYVEFGGTTVVNWSIDKRIWEFENAGELSLRGEINNLFDEDYASVLDYPQPGRNFYLGVRYTY